jgi:hypothetical protein
LATNLDVGGENSQRTWITFFSFRNFKSLMRLSKLRKLSPSAIGKCAIFFVQPLAITK